MLYGETSTAEQGKIVESIAVGKHRLQVSRDGYAEQAMDIMIQKNKTTIITVSPQRSSLQVKKQSGNAVQLAEQVGTLTVRSLPLEAAISLDGKAVGTTNSEVTGVPAGQHEIELRRESEVLRARFTLEQGDTLDILASFLRMEVTLSSTLAERRAREEADRKAADERARVKAEQDAAAAREKAVAALAAGSTYRIAVRSFPTRDQFAAFLGSPREAFAYVTPPGQTSHLVIGGADKVRVFGSRFWENPGNRSALRENAAHEKWMRKTRYGSPTGIGRAIREPVRIAFPVLVHMDKDHREIGIGYTEAFSVVHMFKTNSEYYRTDVVCVVDEREVELRPGSTTVWVDVIVKGETLEFRVAEVEYENPLEGTKEKVAY